MKGAEFAFVPVVVESKMSRVADVGKCRSHGIPVVTHNTDVGATDPNTRVGCASNSRDRLSTSVT